MLMLLSRGLAGGLRRRLLEREREESGRSCCIGRLGDAGVDVDAEGRGVRRVTGTGERGLAVVEGLVGARLCWGVVGRGC